MQGNDDVTNAILKTLFTSSSPLRHFPQKEKKKKKKEKDELTKIIKLTKLMKVKIIDKK